jgi:two-component sensor histidine kinase
MRHQSSNDLQLIVSLLALQSAKAEGSETRRALRDAMERVAILAGARSATHHETRYELSSALCSVCDALQSQAEPRGILLSLDIAGDARGLTQQQTTALTLVVNELATNAIKHAFPEGKPGRIRISVKRDGEEMFVEVEDDGCPFHRRVASSAGLGLDLADRLIASVGGRISAPDGRSKIFAVRVPIAGRNPVTKNQSGSTRSDPIGAY